MKLTFYIQIYQTNLIAGTYICPRMIFSELQCFTKPYGSITTTIILRKLSSSMPKNRQEHFVELKKIRTKLKAASTKYIPSRIKIQIVGNGARNSARSLYITTDHINYLFNCGEGTQRLTTEHHTKLAKLSHIFLTKTSWENMGGIPGVLLSIQDSGVSDIQLHGPEGSIGIVEVIKQFVTLDEINVTAADTSKPYCDTALTINYLLLKNPKSQNLDKNTVEDEKEPSENGDYFDCKEINSNGKRSRSPEIKQQRLNERLVFPKERIDDMMVYICKINSRPGSLDLEKCLEAGVPPGPLLGKLKNGEDITLPNGNVIKSSDVVNKAEGMVSLIVLECPNENWIDVIVENPAFLQYQEGTATKTEDIAKYIVHFTPKNILNNSKYRNWMRKFGKTTEHLILNESNTGFSTESLYKMQHKLRILDSTIFPFVDRNPYTVNQLHNQDLNMDEEGNSKSIESSESKAEDNELVIHSCNPLHVFNLRPLEGFNPNSGLKINPKEYIDEVFAIDGFLDVLAELQTEMNAKNKLLADAEEYPKLIMLGTGSAIPNKVRNTSGILLQLDGNNNIILDCGESTVKQIIKFFGGSEADHVLKSIKAIFISHMHTDHHIGLIGILKEREKLTDEKVFILAPQQITPYLNYYHHTFEPILHLFHLVSNRDIIVNQNILTKKKSEELYKHINVANFNTSFVKHCPFAYAISITLKNGQKICYSGDTMPCETMVNLARDSLLLIHEATMEDGLEQEAFVKKHSTMSQAIKVGVEANASFTLLTHFSQRYSKMPLLPDKNESNIDYNRVGIAFDFMSISLSKLSLLPLLYPALDRMFSEYTALLDQRALKRDSKMENLVKSAI